ncbi:MAG: hypothetical protein KF745_12420 [Phycisphaeraceae bacterium]|nr:hypothetical protein [Phycisphaeraceae bacterium]
MPRSPTPPQAARLHHPSVPNVLAMRELFWHNVVREMLTALSMMQGTRPELFDGRTAVLTRQGERIPIAEIFPLFACGIPGTPAVREASVAVECTVFRLKTPGGEVFTFPVSEIRGLHSLTPELVQQLEQAALSDETIGGPSGPFGFAAFAPPNGVSPPANLPGEPPGAVPKAPARPGESRKTRKRPARPR